jgi:hypothetical protein
LERAGFTVRASTFVANGNRVSGELTLIAP